MHVRVAISQKAAVEFPKNLWWVNQYQNRVRLMWSDLMGTFPTPSVTQCPARSKWYLDAELLLLSTDIGGSVPLSAKCYLGTKNSCVSRSLMSTTAEPSLSLFLRIVNIRLLFAPAGVTLQLSRNSVAVEKLPTIPGSGGAVMWTWESHWVKLHGNCMCTVL